MKALKLLPILALALQASAFAGILTVEPSGKSLENVALAKGASFKLQNGTSARVYTVGAALRSKKVVALPVKVYVGQLLVSEPGKFSRADDQALGSLGTMPSVAMQLTFLRTVGAADILKVFTDGFVSNKYPLDNAVVKKVLDFAKGSGDFESGKTLVVTGETAADGSELVVMENTKGTTVSIAGPKGTVATVMSLWIGVLPANDDGLLKFKKELLSGANL
jgi:hypothetical protein